MSLRWSEEEHDIIRFINSYNNEVTNSGYKEMRYTADDVYDIWNNYLADNYRGFESVKHKLREVDSFSLNESMIKFLNSNRAPTIMDLMEYYHIFDFMAEKCLEYYEQKFMKEFYDRDTEEIFNEDLKETIIENPIVDHNINIDSGSKPILVKHEIINNPEETALVNTEPDKKLEIPDAPTKKKGKNASKKITKKSKYRTLAEAEQSKPLDVPEEPFAALKELVNSYKVHIKIGIIGDTHIGNIFCLSTKLFNYIFLTFNF